MQVSSSTPCDKRSILDSFKACQTCPPIGTPFPTRFAVTNETDIVQTIVPGISLDDSGQAIIDRQMGQRLITLAIALEDHTPHPVDVQHVVAAIIYAARDGRLALGEPLPEQNPELLRLLAAHVNRLFAEHGGNVSGEE